MRWFRASQPPVGLRLHVLHPHPVTTECSGGSDGFWKRTTLSSSAQVFSVPLILVIDMTAQGHISFVLFSCKILDIPFFLFLFFFSHCFRQSTTHSGSRVCITPFPSYVTTFIVSFPSVPRHTGLAMIPLLSTVSSPTRNAILECTHTAVVMRKR